MNEKIPYFLINPTSFLKKKDLTVEEADKEFLRSISTLYSLGYKQEELLNGPIDTSIKKTFRQIKKKFPKGSTNSINLINYVYTRDQVINPFGPWIEIPYYFPLAVYEFTKEGFYDYEDDQIFKMAGFFFALYLFKTHLREVTEEEKLERLNNLEKGRVEFELRNLNSLKRRLHKEIYYEESINGKILYQIFHPKTLYFVSNLSQPTFNQYLNRSWDVGDGISFLYDEIKIKDRIYQQLNLNGLDSLRKVIDKHIEDNRLRYDSLVEEIADKERSGIAMTENSKLQKMSRFYESKFIRDKSGYLSKPALLGNLFIRISKSENGIFLYSQLYLINYKLLFYSLYTEVREKSSKSRIPKQEIDLNNYVPAYLEDKFIKRIRSIKLKDFDRIFDKIESVCKEFNLLIKTSPIDSPQNNSLVNKHFEQIESCYKIVKRISDRGICIKTEELNQIISESDEELTLAERIDESLENQINEVDENEEMDGLNKFKSKIWWLEQIKKSSKQIGRQEGRIYGYFTTHGASTHRMTCRDINLQGIPKKIRRRIYTAPKGYSLISLDVSGQDLIMAAHMARKMFKDPAMKVIIGKDEMRLGLANIEITIRDLQTEPKSTPVDYILGKLINQLPEVLDNIDRGDLREIVKKCIYIHFYGGGFNAIKDSLSQSNLEEYEEDIEQLFENIVDIIYTEYPGVLDSLPYYKDYITSDSNKERLMYPTFLGWQTTLDARHRTRPDYLATRSQSYPIQASGAEFIRQWLIEISKINGYANRFHICNVIHDQVMIEVKTPYAEEIRAKVIEASKTAGRSLGIEPNAINLSYDTY